MLLSYAVNFASFQFMSLSLIIGPFALIQVFLQLDVTNTSTSLHYLLTECQLFQSIQYLRGRWFTYTLFPTNFPFTFFLLNFHLRIHPRFLYFPFFLSLLTVSSESCEAVIQVIIRSAALYCYSFNC